MRPPTRPELEKLSSIMSYQFGRSLGYKLPRLGIQVETSPRTGRIRRVYSKGLLVATLRPRDGYLALTMEGGQLIHGMTESPRQRVVVNKDVAQYARAGRSIFAKHVLRCDPEIRPGDEVIVVDEDDDLLAVGRAVLSAEEMLSIKRGVAMKTREGAGNA